MQISILSSPLSAAEFYLSKSLVPLALQGKVPITPKWSSITSETALSHLQDHQGNIGLRTGKVSGIVVLDIDVKDEGMAAWKSVAVDREPQTLTTITGSGGLHLYFKYDERTSKLRSRSKVYEVEGKKVGWDIKADGGQVVAYPSIHPDTGKMYVWKDDIWMNPIPMPEWLYILLTQGEEQGTFLLDGLASKPSVTIKMVGRYETDKFTLLLNLLAPSRKEHYESWLHVGMALKSLGDKYFQHWDTWSQTSEKYRIGECANKWMSFGKEQGLTMGSIHYWAKEDSPEDYARLFGPKPYNLKEPYYLNKLVSECNGCLDLDLEEARDFLLIRASKCLRLINSARREVLVKSNSRDLTSIVPWNSFCQSYKQVGVRYTEIQQK